MDRVVGAAFPGAVVGHARRRGRPLPDGGRAARRSSPSSGRGVLVRLHLWGSARPDPRSPRPTPSVTLRAPGPAVTSNLPLVGAAASRGRRLLGGGGRRRDLLLRRRHLLRLHGRHAAQRADRGHGRHAERRRATGRWRPTAGSSPSATPPSTAPWAARRSTRRSWAWRPRRAATGYWEVAADGGIFSFGDATFLGSMGGTPLNAPIVGMAATPSGDGLLGGGGRRRDLLLRRRRPSSAPWAARRSTRRSWAWPPRRAATGYWEVAADGGIFTFDAPFFGSRGGQTAADRFFAMVPTPDGGGYLLTGQHPPGP